MATGVGAKQSKLDTAGYQNTPKTWGIHNGILFSLWPTGVETGDVGIGGPRGLLRMGYEYKGKTYLVNFIAIEPIVNGKIEFSEISPSRVDGKWGKVLWAGDTETADAYNPATTVRGVISHPEPAKPEIEQLTVFVFTEQYFSGAHPYFKISIRSDRPDEICFEINNKVNSAKMERCALTATMGNYSRLRELHLADEIIDSRKLYSGYNDIDFIEKESYAADRFLKLKDRSPIVIATANETTEQLSAWPTDSAYNTKKGWRYRVPVKLTQYWRKDAGGYDASLAVRVNGRAKYWAVASKTQNNMSLSPVGRRLKILNCVKNITPAKNFITELA
ncbi:hypothetical protein [Mucilaginibacter antarcticus]|uniref:hypothetical protein n=1 Tax=Mucilaginibacter antarcticus TaxID=1855725 RepID=UPI00362A9921